MANLVNFDPNQPKDAEYHEMKTVEVPAFKIKPKHVAIAGLGFLVLFFGVLALACICYLVGHAFSLWTIPPDRHGIVAFMAFMFGCLAAVFCIPIGIILD